MTKAINILKTNKYLVNVSDNEWNSINSNNTKLNNLVNLLKNNKYIKFIKQDQWNSI